ncbi:hypothetical protein Zmor_008052 [Zophobas morio]|uniref:Luciferin 4-monooxygenase n=1 Tax=Zophobas morio TaxID=2755281 RepID=A0AA38MMQ1_9CUCU|nr:hypothetical protein Zmor_008052 [Zophobas morio]
MSARILKGKEFHPNFDKISFGEFLFECCEKYADRICQIDGDLDKSETYSSVKTRSTRVALNLQKKGITSTDVVCFCSTNSLDNSIPLIASSYLGAKVVNLDPTLSVRNIQHLLSLVTPRIIFVEEESLKLIEKSLKGAKLSCEIIVFGKSTKHGTFAEMTLPCGDEKAFKPSKTDIDDTAVMFFSSGTTGLPKAICHSHRSFLQIVETSFYCGYDCRSILHFTTMYWITGMAILGRTFLDGSTRVFARSMEGEKTLQMIEKYKLTSLFVAPIYTYQLTNVPNPERYDLSSFRCLLTGGTPMSTDQYKKLTQLFPKAQVLFGYGMSEIGLLSIFHPEDDKHLIDTKVGSCGKVSPRTLLKIVNPDNEEIVGPNQEGEVRAKSDAMMTGYYRNDSAECFDGDGFLKTGDIGYYDDDGCVYVIERIKEMFKYQSWHIVPSSIEAVLLEHPDIEETVVFGLPGGAEGDVPAACVVLKDGCTTDKEEIEKFVTERVSDKEKLRGGVIFVESIPKTPTGKLIRKEAKEIAEKFV